MKLRGLFLLVGLACLLFPMAASAQDSDSEEDDFLLRVNGTTTIPAGEVINTAVIINGDVNVAGTIADTLVVIKGDAVITGTVESDVILIRSDLALESGAVVNDIMDINSDITGANDQTVTGDIEERSGDFSLGRGFAIFSILFWVGLLIVGIVAGAFFAWLGRAQLYNAVDTLRTQFVPSLITAILLWIVLPIIGGIIIFTIIGAPLGISILVVLLPILWLLGAIVIAAWIGHYVVPPTTRGRAIGSTVLGIVVIGLVSLIPFVAIVVGLAGMLGSGGLVYRAIMRSRDVTPAPEPASA
jgi:hypothetical protein